MEKDPATELLNIEGKNRSRNARNAAQIKA